MFGASQNTNMFSNFITNGSTRRDGNAAESGGP